MASLLQRASRTIKRWLGLQKPVNVAMLGIDYAEFKYAEKLEASGRYQVLYYIDDNPWNYRNKLGQGVIRSLSDLQPLCEKHQIAFVTYIEADWLEKCASYSLPLISAEELLKR